MDKGDQLKMLFFDASFGTNHGGTTFRMIPVVTQGTDLQARYMVGSHAVRFYVAPGGTVNTLLQTAGRVTSRASCNLQFQGHLIDVQ